MKAVKSILLLLVAFFLAALLLPTGFVISIVKAVFKGRGEKYLYKIAVSIDQLGNTVCCDLFNWTLIRKSPFRFGSTDETISSVLGKNKLNNSLTKTGKALCFLLNLIEKNHVESAIGN